MQVNVRRTNHRDAGRAGDGQGSCALVCGESGGGWRARVGEGEKVWIVCLNTLKTAAVVVIVGRSCHLRVLRQRVERALCSRVPPIVDFGFPTL